MDGINDMTGEYEEEKPPVNFEREPKVLIACPTYEGKAYCLLKFLAALKELDYKNKEIVLADNSPTEEYSKRIKRYADVLGVRIKVIKTEREENTKETLARARNSLRDIFLKGDYDLFFSLEQDVIIGKDDLTMLVSGDKDAISGIVWQILPFKGGEQRHPLLWRQYSKMPEDKMYFLRPEQLEGEKLIQVYAASMSCLLIKRNCLQRISFRTEGKGWDDVYFCSDMKKEGFSVWADTRVRPKHIIRQGTVLK